MCYVSYCVLEGNAISLQKNENYDNAELYMGENTYLCTPKNFT